MPLPTAPHLKVVLNFRVQATGAQASCTCWYTKTAGADPTIATLPTIADAMVAHFKTPIKAALNTNTNLQNIKCTWRDGGTQFDAYNTDGTNTGTIAEDNMPERSAVVMQRLTGYGGRQNRGRIFFPFVVTTNQAEGRLTSPGGIALYTAVATKLNDTVTVAGVVWNPMHCNFKSGVFVAIAQIRVDNDLCSRRDRDFPHDHFASNA